MSVFAAWNATVRSFRDRGARLMANASLAVSRDVSPAAVALHARVGNPF